MHDAKSGGAAGVPREMAWCMTVLQPGRSVRLLLFYRRMLDGLELLDPARLPPGRKAGVAVAISVLATGLRYALDPVLPAGLPFITYFPSVILISMLCGAGAGAVASLALGVLGLWLFGIPGGLGGPVLYATALAAFVLIAGLCVAAVDLMHRALRRAEAARAEAARLARSRDLMFRELQHRISNNLSVIAGYLSVQRRRLSDPQARQALEEANARISVVAQLQRLLHDPSDENVRVSCFMAKAAAEMLAAAGAAGRITLTVEDADVRVWAADAIPLGLIATEMIANAVEHGFADGMPGRIGIAVERIGPDHGRLTVQDNGRGLPEGFDLESGSGLGLTVARGFAAQIGGCIRLCRRDTGGTSAEVEFRCRGVPDPSPDPETQTARTVTGPGRAAGRVAAAA